MPEIDYSQYSQQAQSAGRRAGKAQGELMRQQRERDRKLRLEQRYAQLAKDKQMHENELAKTEYIEAVKAQSVEANDFAEHSAKGWIDGDGMYTDKYFEDKAYDEWANSGVSRSSEDETAWRTQGGMTDAVNRLRSGHAKYKTRNYRKLDAEDLYRQRLEFNQRQAERDMSRPVYSEGLTGAGEKLGDGLVDAIFGKAEQEARPTQEIVGDPRAQERFETMEIQGKPVDYTKPMTQKPNIGPMQLAYETDAEGNTIGNQKQIYLDKNDRQAYEMRDGALVPVDYNYKVVSMDKTGEGAPRKLEFKSPLHDKDTASELRQTGDTIASMDDLIKVADDKLSNPKDWADRLIESTSNQLAAVVGFDGTEIEMVNAWFNSQSDQEKDAIRDAMGYGVEDQIHKGNREALELFATYRLARTMAGGGKLNVNTIEAAKNIVNGSGGTKDLAKLKSGITNLQKQHRRRVTQVAHDHNDQLMMMEDSEAKRSAERLMGYPVFSEKQYVERMNQLGQRVDPAIVAGLQKAYQRDIIFNKDEYGVTYVPTLIRVRDQEGNEGFSLEYRPMNFD